MSEATLTLHHHLSPEDQARAEFYALLARLFADAPDTSLLAAIAGAPPLGPSTHTAGDSAADGLAAAWDTVRAELKLSA